VVVQQQFLWKISVNSSYNFYHKKYTMLFKPFKVFLLLTLLSCNNKANSSNAEIVFAPLLQHPYYANIEQIPLPKGYKRTAADNRSFAAWLRKIGLKTDNTVYLFDGSKKENQSAQFAVLDISVSKKNLQQCADAVMRLRAEYLFTQRNFDTILFADNDGTKYIFKQPYSRQNFDTYLDRVFGMCGSASLAKQLKPTTMQYISPGDVLIHGGFPGHAVIVLDVATDSEGNKIYLLAQSYMPAQDIHLLNNPSNKKISPWYLVNEDEKIETPEYLFTKHELKKW
jgi:hypothetical protein